MVEPDLQWHPSLYAGSARYYAIGRVGYPPALADALASELALDGSGRLLDVGCGPGNFTLLLAPWFEHATGLDADRDMLAEAERRAAQAGIGKVTWLQLRAEELPAGLGPYRVASFAQSFHWMDQLQVARVVLRMLEDGGVFARARNDAPRCRDRREVASSQATSLGDRGAGGAFSRADPSHRK
jgi:ubiquinone/menaquinone biosynthesis C-methylase UbiE